MRLNQSEHKKIFIRQKTSGVKTTQEANGIDNDESESQLSEDSSCDIDSEYKKDRYSFLEVGRILDLTEPIFSEDEISLMVKSILIGLSHVHELNLVHRDIKPENIIVKPKQLSTEED